MADMLRMTDYIDGFYFTPHIPFPFYPVQSDCCDLTILRPALAR
jgi:hypothetical protein